MARRTLQELYKEFMSNPHRTPMPGKTKHETALEEAHKQMRQSYNNDMALSLMPKSIEAQYTHTKKLDKEIEEPFAVATAQAQKLGYTDFSEGSPGAKKRSEIAEAIKVSKLLKGITKEDISKMVVEIVKQVGSSAAERAKAKGLVPQSGDEQHPGRWVKPGHQKKKPTVKKPVKRGKGKKKRAAKKIQAKNVTTKG